MKRRRAIILATVLVMIGLLALSMAGFLFFVRAETAGIIATSDGQQARLATESGFEELTTYLRADRHNFAVWYDNPDRFRNALVWGDGFKRDADPMTRYRTREEMRGSGEKITAAWRYSIVAERLDGPEDAIRFGVMPESGKLNLNSATDQQLSTLIAPLLAGLSIDNPQEIIDPILDWRDGDSEQRANGAENEYYQRQTPAYNAKNNRFDTVEELLLVKGVTAAILYGEDVNRNGVLDLNEDDGDASPPEYDNADGTLNRGIAPYLTVYSREVDTALDNKPRINLNGNAAAVATQIAEQFKNGEISDATIAFLTNLSGAGINPSMLRSPADLFPPAPEEQYVPEAAPPTQPPTSAPAPSGGQTDRDEQQPESGNPPTDRTPTTPRNIGKAGSADKGMQDTPVGGGDKGGGENDGQTGGRGNRGPVTSESGGQTPPRGDTPAPAPGGDQPQPNRGGRGGRGGPGGTGGSSVTPESMFNSLKASPVTMQELPYIMDRFSTRPPQQAAGLMEGLVNINAAPYLVLLTVPGMTAETAGKIVATRSSLDGATLSTTAWPLTSGALDPAAWKRIAPYVTTKAYQFHIEIVGYADHVQTARRYEWVIEMVGPMAQVKYYRDLTALGFAWPVDQDVQVVAR